jgi:hypothetical protein
MAQIELTIPDELARFRLPDGIQAGVAGAFG